MSRPPYQSPESRDDMIRWDEESVTESPKMTVDFINRMRSRCYEAESARKFWIWVATGLFALILLDSLGWIHFEALPGGGDGAGDWP